MSRTGDDSSTSDSGRTRPVSDRLLTLALATLGMLAFAPALGGGFIFDDRRLIQENTYIHSFDWWTRWFATGFWEANVEIARFSPHLTYYRPAVTASYAVDWLVGDGSPLVFHVTNLLLHAVVAALAYRAFRRWTETQTLAVIFAALFVVHPTKAESVAWIAGRTDILCTIALFVAAEGAARRLAGRRGGLALELAGTVAAYLSKETAIVLFALLFVEFWVHQGRVPLTWAFLLRALRWLLPQLAIAVGYLVARAVFLPVSGKAGIVPVTLLEHTQMVLETLGRSAELLLVPHRLSVQQGLIWPGETGRIQLSLGYAALGAVTIVLLLVSAWRTRSKLPGVAVGLGLFAVTYAPTSNLIPTTMPTLLSERFLYVPLLGVCLAGAAALARVPRVWPGAVTALAVAVYGGLAARRSHDFSDERAFWAREMALNPLSLEAHRNMVLFASEDRRYRDALDLFAKAHASVRITYPNSRIEFELVIDSLELVAYLTPDTPPAGLRAIAGFYEQVLAAVDLLSGFEGEKPRVARLEVGRLRIEQSLEVLSRDVTLKKTRRKLLFGYADIQSRRGNDPVAVAYADRAVEDCPDCVLLVIDAAQVHARAGDYEGARRLLDSLVPITRLPVLATARERIERAAAFRAEAERVQGPPALILRAQELSTLAAYGRAYAVLEPHRAEIERVRELSMTFAELAWRAGQFDVSRALLGKHLTPEEVARMTRGWNEKMGWEPMPPEP